MKLTAPGPRIIAIANQKGGVGKTTTSVSLAAGLAQRGHRVLLIDLDPQGNASTGLGLGLSGRKKTIHDLLFSDRDPVGTIHATGILGLEIVPATTDLASADLELVATTNRLFVLKDKLTLLSQDYAFVLVDCPPALNLLTLNALVAASSVLIPLQSEFFALEGLSQLMLTIRSVRQEANPGLRLEGVVLTMVDYRNRLTSQVEKDVRSTLGELVFETTIPRNVRLSEAPSYGLPIQLYDIGSKGAIAYEALCDEMLRRYDLRVGLEGRT